MARRRLVSGLCLLVGMALATYARFYGTGIHVPRPESIARLHRRLPALPVTDLAGRQADLSELASGSRSVIVFYSASCRLCREVLPELAPFPRSLKLIMVNEAAGGKPGSGRIPGLEEALQMEDPNRVLVRSFPMSMIPTILFVDEQAILRDGLVGERARGRLRRKLKEFAEVP